jgi:hypothetical protein
MHPLPKREFLLLFVCARFRAHPSWVRGTRSQHSHCCDLSLFLGAGKKAPRLRSQGEVPLNRASPAFVGNAALPQQSPLRQQSELMP